MKEIARVQRGKNNMETARAFAKCEAFRWCSIADIIATMRVYQNDGLLIFTDTEAIMYHNCDN